MKEITILYSPYQKVPIEANPEKCIKYIKEIYLYLLFIDNHYQDIVSQMQTLNKQYKNHEISTFVGLNEEILCILITIKQYIILLIIYI